MLPRSLGLQDVVLLHLHLLCVNHKKSYVYVFMCRLPYHAPCVFFDQIVVLILLKNKLGICSAAFSDLLHWYWQQNCTIPVANVFQLIHMFSHFWVRGDFEHFFGGLWSSSRVAIVASFCVNKLIDRQHQNNGSGGEGDLRTGKLVALKKNNFSGIWGIWEQWKDLIGFQEGQENVNNKHIRSDHLWEKLGSEEWTWMFSQQAPRNGRIQIAQFANCTAWPSHKIRFKLSKKTFNLIPIRFNYW